MPRDEVDGLRAGGALNDGGRLELDSVPLDVDLKIGDNWHGASRGADAIAAEANEAMADVAGA